MSSILTFCKKSVNHSIRLHTCVDLTSIRANVSLPPREAIVLLQILKIDDLRIILRCSNLEELIFRPSSSIPTIRYMDGSVVTMKRFVNRRIFGMKCFELESCQ
jgi:hypothetical protein